MHTDNHRSKNAITGHQPLNALAMNRLITTTILGVVSFSSWCCNSLPPLQTNVTDIAAQTWNKELVETLLATEDADINAKDNHGRNALIYAVQTGDKELLKTLLAKGADINAQDQDGHTPLIHAARNGKQELVETLLAKGANINAQDQDGMNALMYVAVDDGGERSWWKRC